MLKMVRMMVILIGWNLSLGPVLVAKGSQSDDAAPTFSFDLTLGIVTSKSQVVASNDTGTGFTYGLGGYAGQNRSFGFLYRHDESSTTFELNDSSGKIIWQDTVIRYRFAFVSLGIVFSHLGAKINREGTDIMDISGEGMGGVLAFAVPIGRVGTFHLEVLTVSLSSPRNHLDQELSLGSRFDTSLSASFDLTQELLDFIVGYKQRSWQVNADIAATEEYLSTFLGFRLAANF